MHVLSDNGISKVWLEDGVVFKKQPKYMTDNEIFALRLLRHTGLVPIAEQLDLELIRMEYLSPDPEIEFHPADFFFKILLMLRAYGIRHGDLTAPHIIVVSGSPVIIDWGESRVWGDPRPDKRPEGDAHWLKKTLEELCGTTI